MIDEMQARKIGLAIWRARKEAGLSQKDLAELIGVSVKTIRKWENGERIPRPEAIARIEAIIKAGDKKVPFCPGCGMPMRTFGPNTSTYGREIYYICSYSCVCGWHAPFGKGATPQEAKERALKNACSRYG